MTAATLARRSLRVAARAQRKLAARGDGAPLQSRFATHECRLGGRWFACRRFGRMLLVTTHGGGVYEHVSWVPRAKVAELARRAWRGDRYVSRRLAVPSGSPRPTLPQ